MAAVVTHAKRVPGAAIMHELQAGTVGIWRGLNEVLIYNSVIELTTLLVILISRLVSSHYCILGGSLA